MKKNPLLKRTILEVVDNQIKNNDPPETAQTLKRLKNEGYSEKEAREFIGVVVSAEIFDVLKNKEEYNRERFVKALNNLPKMPWE
jgi:hypothetical protein